MKVHWCWLECEHVTSIESPLDSAVVVLHVGILEGWCSSARWGTPCSCAVWITTRATTSLLCSCVSSVLTGLGASGWIERSTASTSDSTHSAAHDIQDRLVLSGPCRVVLPPLVQEAGQEVFLGRRPCKRPFGQCV